MSPMLVRELRATFRGRGFHVIHLLALGLLSFAVLGFARTEQTRWLLAGPSVGSGIFCLMLLLLSSLAFLVLPAYGSTSIVAERENHSLDLLVTTTLRPVEIVWGKFAASLVYGIVFFTSALPVICLCFVFGGVSLLELALGYAALLCQAVVLAIGAVCVSAWSPSTPWAITAGYALSLGLAGVTLLPAAGGALFALGNGRLPNAVVLESLAALPASHLALALLGGLYAVGSWFALCFLLAANALTPPADDRSTGLRAFYGLFAGVGAGLGLAGLAVAWPGWTADERWQAAAAAWTASSVAAVTSAALGCESPGLSIRLRAALERLRGARALLRPLFPGPGRAWGFVIAVNAALLGAVYFGVLAIAGDPLPGPAAAPDLHAASRESLAVTAAFLAFASALAFLLGRWVRTPWIRVTVLAGVLALLAGAPPVLYALDRGSGPGRGPGLWNGYFASPVLAYGSIWEGRRVQQRADPAARYPTAFPCNLTQDLPGTPVWQAFGVAYGALAAVLALVAGIGVALGRAP